VSHNPTQNSSDNIPS